MRKLMLGLISTILILQVPLQIIEAENLVTDDQETISQIKTTNDSNNETLEYVIEAEEIDEEIDDEVIDESTLFETLDPVSFMVDNIKPSYTIDNVDTAKLSPTEPITLQEVTVNNVEEFEKYLLARDNNKILVGTDFNFPNKSMTIPAGYSKEVDLQKHTIFAANSSRIIVTGDYFKLKNGNIVGGGQDSTTIPGEGVSPAGFIHSAERKKKMK